MLAMTTQPLWCLPPENLALAGEEIHIWRASLGLRYTTREALFLTLNPDEQGRAERYCFQKDREHFIAARGVLREILGGYLKLEPEQLRFSYNAYGKPALVGEDGGCGLRFNLSHSHGLALFAIARGREIGVDVEFIRSRLTDEQIGERFFSPREVAGLRALPAEMQREAFFACWTRKEAFIKAKGKGLSLPLDQFDVSLTPGEPASLMNTQEDPHEVFRWSLRELFPGRGYAAALAVEGKAGQIKYWQWSKTL